MIGGVSLFYLAWIVFSVGMGTLCQVITGFGSSVISSPIMNLVVPYDVNYGVLTILSLYVPYWLAFKYRKKINFKTMIYPLVSFLITNTICVKLMGSIDGNIMKALLGVALVILGIWYIFFNGKLNIKASPLNGVICGLLSGVTGGLFHMGGPPVAVYFVSSTDDPEEYIGTTNFYFTCSCTITMINWLINGNYKPEVLPTWGATLVGVILFYPLGKFIFNKVKDKGIQNFKKAVYWIILVCGISTLAASVPNLIK